MMAATDVQQNTNGFFNLQVGRYIKPKTEDGTSLIERLLGEELERWLQVKQFLNVQEDHVVAKVLLDFFQAHGGFDVPWRDRIPPEWQVAGLPLNHTLPSTETTVATTADGSDGTGQHSAPLLINSATEPCPEAESTISCEPALEGSGSSLPPPPSSESQPRSDVFPAVFLSGLSPAPCSPSPSASPPASPGAAAVVALLPTVDPALVPFFSCGLCGAAGHSRLADHLDHLWQAHTELRMLGSARRPRVPLKLRPHMFVLCALCGLNNRSTSTAGAADRHLSRAHLPARHRRVIAAVSAAPHLQFACDECDVTAASRAELALHVLDTGHACGSSVCRECGLEVDGEINAERHRLWHRVRQPFHCYLCAETFPTEPAAVAHVLAEHASHYNVHKCSRCPYATSMMAQFVQHARAHTGLNACVCHQCGFVFHTSASLRRHLLTHARTEFPCGHCAMTFRHPLPLERHVRSRHTSPEQHRCGHCGKTLSSRYHLERHALIHTGRRPHQCERCGRAFVQKGDLSRHGRRCRPPALEPPPQPPTPPPPTLESKLMEKWTDRDPGHSCNN